MPAVTLALLVACSAPTAWGPAGPARPRDPPLTSFGGSTSAPEPSPTPEPGPDPDPGAEPEPDASGAAPAYGTYAWPVRGPVIRSFDPPATPYGSGHRGIDIATALGTPVGAASGGVVAFVGPVGGALYVSVDHPDGVRTTYSWLADIRVKRGAEVARGEVIGTSGAGHPGGDRPHLHFGARVGQTYIDPMLLLERGSLVGLVHLAPLE